MTSREQILANRSYCEKLQVRAALADIDVVDLVNDIEGKMILYRSKDTIEFIDWVVCLEHMQYSSLVTSMYSLFSYYNDVELDLSVLDTCNVIDMASMFSSCRKLKELNLSNFKSHNIENITEMFADCHELSKVDLSNFDATKLKQCIGIFRNCEKIDVNELIDKSLISQSLKNSRALLNYIKIPINF